jgi:hypothetical protein
MEAQAVESELCSIDFTACLVGAFELSFFSTLLHEEKSSIINNKFINCLFIITFIVSTHH